MKSKRRGFTLIELLVVIAIIAILATVVIINVSGARTKAVSAKVDSDIAVIGRGAEMARQTGTLPDIPPSALVPGRGNVAFFSIQHTLAASNWDSLEYQDSLSIIKDGSGQSIIGSNPKHPLYKGAVNNNQDYYYYFESKSGEYAVSAQATTTTSGPFKVGATGGVTGTRPDNPIPKTGGPNLCISSEGGNPSNCAGDKTVSSNGNNSNN